MSKEKTHISEKLFGPIASIFFVISIFFGSQIWAGILVMPLLIITNNGGTENFESLQNNALVSFTYILLAGVVTLLTLRALLKTEFNSDFKVLGLNKFQLRYLLYALGGFVLYFAFYLITITVVTNLIPGLRTDQKQELGFDMGANGTDLILIFVSLVILPPFVEEIVMRGFLYQGLRSKLGVAVSIIITSAIFASPHLGQSGGNGLLWIAGIDTFILSVVLCLLRERSGSLWPCIGVHMMKNGLAFIILFEVYKKF